MLFIGVPPERVRQVDHNFAIEKCLYFLLFFEAGLFLEDGLPPVFGLRGPDGRVRPPDFDEASVDRLSDFRAGVWRDGFR
jgi:hypothetical protein